MLAERVGLENIQRGLEEEGLPGFTRLTYLVDVRRGIFRNLDIAADDLRPIDVRTIRWTPIWEPQIAKLCEMLGKPPNTYDRQDMFDAYARYYETGVNEAPMRTMGLIYERMLRGELVSREASQKMIELMSDAHTSTNRLLGRLPPGTKVAHKTGSQFNRLCDTGIVFLPDLRPLVVAACMENGLVPPSEENVARLTRKAYDLAIAPRSANGTR
jgi:beta-lactamase class A